MNYVLIIVQKHEFANSDKISVLFQTISLKVWVVMVVGIVNTTESEIDDAIKDKNTFHMAHFIIKVSQIGECALYRSVEKWNYDRPEAFYIMILRSEIKFTSN
jgi:hypothetical protein